MRDYKKYRVWQLACGLVPDIYELTERLSGTERFG